jgi:hypothetical protein
LEFNIKIKYLEIYNILGDYDDTIIYLFTILKNILIITGISYVKSYSPKLYYLAIKNIYNYKTGELLASYNTINAKKYLVNIVEDKKWEDLKTPNTFKAMLYLYQINNDKTDIFVKFVNEFNLLIVKMFSIWTLGSFFDFIYLVPVLSLIFVVYKKSDNLGKKILVIFGSGVVGYFYGSLGII